MGLGFGELQRLGASSWRTDPLLLLVSSVLLLLGYLASAALWGRIVMDLGGPALTTGEAIRIFMVANLGRYVPGKIWQIAGLAVLARNRGIPAATAMGAAVVGQGIALAAATLVALGALVGGPPAIRSWSLPAAGVVAVATVVGLLPPVFARMTGLWFRLSKQEAPRNLGSVHALRWLVLYTANWALYAFSFWVFAASFGHRGDIVPVASAFAAAYVVGYVMIFAPAGLGVREGALVAFLSPLLGVGPSGVVAIVARLWTTGVELVPAAAFWLRHLAGGREHPSGGEGAGE